MSLRTKLFVTFAMHESVECFLAALRCSAESCVPITEVLSAIRGAVKQGTQLTLGSLLFEKQSFLPRQVGAPTKIKKGDPFVILSASEESL